MRNLKRKIDGLDVKTVPADSKNLSNFVDNKAAKKTKFNTLKTKVYNLEKIS